MEKQNILKMRRMRRLPGEHLKLLILGMLAADGRDALYTGTESSTIEKLYDSAPVLRQHCSRRRYLEILERLESSGYIVVSELQLRPGRIAFVAHNGETSNILCKALSPRMVTFPQSPGLQKYLN
jgi:hypothetical protein